MRRFFPFLAMLGLVACEDESVTYDNDLIFSVGDDDLRWRTNDGGCQLRNLGQSLACELRVDEGGGEQAFHLTLTSAAELTERAYRDTVQTADPDIAFDLQFTLRHLTTTSSISDDQVVTIDRLTGGIARGTFEGLVADEATDEVLPLEGQFEMVLSE